MSLFNITKWPVVLIFLLAGSAAVIFAFMTVNLFSQAVASRDFLREHGWVAIQFGALWQVGQLLLWGAIALICWLIFKICEQELEDRYFAWARRKREGAKTRSKA